MNGIGTRLIAVKSIDMVSLLLALMHERSHCDVGNLGIVVCRYDVNIIVNASMKHTRA